MHQATFEEIEQRLNAPGSTRTVVRRVERVQINPIAQAATLQRQRDHWAKLHTTRFTPEEFELWVQSIPGCATCQRDFRKLLETHTPRFDDWHRWSWQIHNAVNEKIGKPIVSWQDACKLWNWDLTAADHPA